MAASEAILDQILMGIANSKVIVPALREFLNTYPLETSSVRDLNTHPAGQQHGTCIIPLWRQTPELHKGSSSWAAYTRFFQCLEPILETAASTFKRKGEEDDADYDEIARRLYLTQVARPPPGSMPLMPPEPMQSWNVFECMRLSANLAPDMRLLDPGDGNRAAILMGFGSARVEMLLPEPQPLALGQFLFVDVGSWVGMRPYEGDFYLIEFFLPKLAVSEAVALPEKENEKGEGKDKGKGKES